MEQPHRHTLDAPTAALVPLALFLLAALVHRAHRAAARCRCQRHEAAQQPRRARRRGGHSGGLVGGAPARVRCGAEQRIIPFAPRAVRSLEPRHGQSARPGRDSGHTEQRAAHRRAAATMTGDDSTPDAPEQEVLGARCPRGPRRTQLQRASPGRCGLEGWLHRRPVHALRQPAHQSPTVESPAAAAAAAAAGRRSLVHRANASLGCADEHGAQLHHRAKIGATLSRRRGGTSRGAHGQGREEGR